MIQSYSDWKSQKIQDWTEDNPKIDCPKCEGEGEIFDTCPCCGHDSDEECGTCEGEGQVYFNELDSTDLSAFFNRRTYQKEVIADLKKWCAYTREDFLGMVGPFIENQRSGGGATVWR